MKILAAALFAAGCSSSSSHPTPMPDACAPHVVYLNFGGVTLTMGNDDAASNVSSIVPGTITVPAFAPGDAAAAEIVGHVQEIFAPYALDIVTTRPALPPYDMVVIGGSPSLVGAGSGSFGIAPEPCATRYNMVSLDFDHGFTSPFTAYSYANTIASDIATFAGLAAATDAGDCLCRNARGCSISSTAACTFSPHANLDLNFSCGRSGPQDEPAELGSAYACD